MFRDFICILQANSFDYVECSHCTKEVGFVVDYQTFQSRQVVWGSRYTDTWYSGGSTELKTNFRAIPVKWRTVGMEGFRAWSEDRSGRLKIQPIKDRRIVDVSKFFKLPVLSRLFNLSLNPLLIKRTLLLCVMTACYCFCIETISLIKSISLYRKYNSRSPELCFAWSS